MNEKLTNAAALSDTREQMSFMKKFTPEELADRRKELSEFAIKQKELAKRMKEVVKPIKEELKGIKVVMDELCDQVKQKGEVVNELCYVQFDAEKGIATYFSESDGDIVYSRPLLPGEGQMSLKFSKAVND